MWEHSCEASLSSLWTKTYTEDEMLLYRGMLMEHSPNGKGEIVASSSFFMKEADRQVLEAM